MSYIILATIKANPGKISTILNHLDLISQEVRASEPDTLQYQVTQSEEDENEVVIWEEYTSPDAQARHREGKAYQAFKADLADLGSISLKKLYPKLELK